MLKLASCGSYKLCGDVAPISGLRRALGARRIDIIRQHLLEVIVVGLSGGAVGMALTLGGLACLKVLMFSGRLAHSDNPDRVALITALAAGRVAGGAPVEALTARKPARVYPSATIRAPGGRGRARGVRRGAG